MSNEKFKWISVTEYVDIDTGEQLAQLQIGTTHYRLKLLESKVITNKRDYERTIKDSTAVEDTAQFNKNMVRN